MLLKNVVSGNQFIIAVIICDVNTADVLPGWILLLFLFLFVHILFYLFIILYTYRSL